MYAARDRSPSDFDVFVDAAGEHDGDEGVQPARHEHDSHAERGTR